MYSTDLHYGLRSISQSPPHAKSFALSSMHTLNLKSIKAKLILKDCLDSASGGRLKQ